MDGGPARAALEGRSTTRARRRWLAVGATLALLTGWWLVGSPAGAGDGAQAGAADATTTTRVVSDEDLVVLREATQASFPEVKEAEARCIGNAALPHMTVATVGMLLRDAGAPIKATQPEQAALADAIDECIGRSSAVQVVAGSAVRLFAQQDSLGMMPSLGYDDLQCIDEELGPLDAGETFFDLYRRPLEFQRLTGRALSACVDEPFMRAALGGWLSFRQWPVQLASAQSAATEACAESLVEGDVDIEILFEQVILAASPDELGDQVDELQELLAQCGLPVPRDFGRGA